MPPSAPAPRTILITGASSGLGEALAKAYAAPQIRLILAGRHAGRLETVAQLCRDRGAETHICCVDVTDRIGMEQQMLDMDQRFPVDLLIANAGISAGTGGGGEDADQTRHIFATNLDGILNTVLPLVPRMQERGRGQIALMASLAGFRGFPSAPAYCASKGAIRLWGEGLRGWLGRDGIRVSVICPGFVRTPLTDRNRFPMPFLMDAGQAARRIQHGLARNRGRISFPWPMRAVVWLLAALPDFVIDRLTRYLPGKGPSSPSERPETL